MSDAPKDHGKPRKWSVVTNLAYGVCLGILLFFGVKFYQGFNSTEPAFRYREF